MKRHVLLGRTQNLLESGALSDAEWRDVLQAIRYIQGVVRVPDEYVWSEETRFALSAIMGKPYIDAILSGTYVLKGHDIHEFTVMGRTIDAYLREAQERAREPEPEPERVLRRQREKLMLLRPVFRALSLTEQDELLSLLHLYYEDMRVLANSVARMDDVLKRAQRRARQEYGVEILDEADERARASIWRDVKEIVRQRKAPIQAVQEKIDAREGFDVEALRRVFAEPAPVGFSVEALRHVFSAPACRVCARATDALEACARCMQTRLPEVRAALFEQKK